jgi:hypothetical protein
MTRVEYQTPGFLEKLGVTLVSRWSQAGHRLVGFKPECGFLVVAFGFQIVGEIRAAAELR